MDTLNMFKHLYFLICLFSLIINIACDTQSGPDPWDLEGTDLESQIRNNKDVPPDLKIYPKKNVQADSSLGAGQWFFKRILNIILKGGQVKKNEDDSVDVSLQMRLDQKQWETLDNYMKSKVALTEDMYRRSVGYIEQAIYKPTITDKIVMAWSDYVQIYLIEYKMYITWTLAILGIAGASIWLWCRMSHRHFMIILFLTLYMYEVFVSYKEAEKQELDRFLSALNSCKWTFWLSSCEAPKPDPLIFIKHMNPLKICIRMFTTVVSEPMVILSDTLKTVVHGMTDGLWYPLDKIVYSILILTFNVILLFFLIMILFNFILNIPFNLSFLFGLVSVGVTQRRRTLFPKTETNSSEAVHADRISGPTLDRLLDVCSKALSTAHSSNSNTQKQITNENNTGIRRSASAGRLADVKNYSFENNNRVTLENAARRRNGAFVGRNDGSGDAH